MIVLWLQVTKSCYFSRLWPSSPVPSLPQQVSWGWGFPATSHLDHPYSAVKADTKALAPTFCQLPSHHTIPLTLSCALCTTVLGPTLPKQKLSFASCMVINTPDGSAGGSLVTVPPPPPQKGARWTIPTTRWRSGPLRPALYCTPAQGPGFLLMVCLVMKTCLLKEFLVNCFKF